LFWRPGPPKGFRFRASRCGKIHHLQFPFLLSSSLISLSECQVCRGRFGRWIVKFKCQRQSAQAPRFPFVSPSLSLSPLLWMRPRNPTVAGSFSWTSLFWSPYVLDSLRSSFLPPKFTSLSFFGEPKEWSKFSPFSLSRLFLAGLTKDLVSADPMGPVNLVLPRDPFPL